MKTKQTGDSEKPDRHAPDENTHTPDDTRLRDILTSKPITLTGIGTILIGIAAILALIFNQSSPKKTQVELTIKDSADLDKLVQTGKPEEISEVRESVRKIKADPQTSFVDKAIAEAYRLQFAGEIDNAIEKWRSIANAAEGIDQDIASRAWSSVGHLSMEEGEEEKARFAYNKAVDLKPDFTSYYMRGKAKDRLGQYEAAITDYDNALRLEPDIFEVYYMRGKAKSRLGQYEAAITDYDEVIRLTADSIYPDHDEAYYYRGEAKRFLGKYKEAIADYDEAINRDLNTMPVLVVGASEKTLTMLSEPNLAHAHSSRGIAKSKLGQYEAAIADYNEALKLRPDFAETYHDRGIAKSELGQYEAAIADYTIAIRLIPNEANVYINLGIAKVRLGQIKEARADFQIGLELAKQADDETLKAHIEQHLQELDSME